MRAGLVLVAALWCVQLRAGPQIHVVQTGETLSSIAQLCFGLPVYGDGSLARLVRLNPEIENPDKIFPGQRLRLVEVDAEAAASPRAPAAAAATATAAPAPVPAASPSVPAPSAPAPAPAPDDPSLIRDLWVWFGLGVNFTSYSQSVPGISDVSFGRIMTPSELVRAGFFFSDHGGLDLSYKSTPGEAESSSSITVSNGNYVWRTMSADFIYRPADAESHKRSEWLWRLGVQQHQMPFMVPLSANAIEIESSSLTALSAGTEYRWLRTKKLRIELMGRLQYPLSASSDVGSSFKITPKLTFDGSMGAAYEFYPRYFLGVYWYGQLHHYGFSYVPAGGSRFSGSQSLFYSDLDLRLGTEF